MNLDITRRRTKTVDLLLCITRNCERLIKQTHRKPQETLEFKLNQPKETFSFIPPISTEPSWMIGLTNLKVYSSISIIAEENNNFEHYTDLVDEFSFTEIKD